MVKTPQSKPMMTPEMVMLVCLICVIQDEVSQQVLHEITSTFTFLIPRGETLLWKSCFFFFLCHSEFGQTIELLAIKFLLDLNNTIL